MKRFLGFYIVLMFIGSNLMAGSSPLKVSAGKYYNKYSRSYIPQVTITSLSNSLKIKNVIVNKGNCKYSKTEMYGTYSNIKYRKIFPKKLSYGKQLKIAVHRCNILKVEVQTNKGDWSVEY